MSNTRYVPFDIGLPCPPCTQMDLADLRHGYRGNRKGRMPLNAWFSLGGDDSRYLLLDFSHVDIVCVLDETWLSTEEEPASRRGLVPNHFGYAVENSRFWNAQSEHYQRSHPMPSTTASSPAAPVWM